MVMMIMMMSINYCVSLLGSFLTSATHAEQNLAQIAWDLDYLRDQMTITEVKLFLQKTRVLTPHFLDLEWTPYFSGS